MRYFLTLSYLGTHYNGWQSQPNAPSVQATIEQALSTFLGGVNCPVTGCGRTDTGVHARNYVAHFDSDKTIPGTFLKGINSLLPADIAIHDIRPVGQEGQEAPHARFSAFERSYEYHIVTRKDPFFTQTAWIYPAFERLDLEKMQAVGRLLLRYHDFFPFCKTDSSTDHYRCDLLRAEWLYTPEEHHAVFHITANRFLRGMVRLIVGACIQAGKDQLSLQQIQHALETQTPLPKSLSVPPNGLFLTGIKYV
jgi:tRNA pseudouridine38-40 synthase